MPMPKASILPLRTLFAFLLAFVAIFTIGLLAEKSLRHRTDSAGRVSKTMELIRQLGEVLSTLKDAETGQRGYLLTSAVVIGAYAGGIEALMAGRPDAARAAGGSGTSDRRDCSIPSAAATPRRSGRVGWGWDSTSFSRLCRGTAGRSLSRAGKAARSPPSGWSCRAEPLLRSL